MPVTLCPSPAGAEGGGWAMPGPLRKALGAHGGPGKAGRTSLAEAAGWPLPR